MAEEARFTNYWEPEDEDNVYNPDDLNYGREDEYHAPIEELMDMKNWVGYRLEARNNGKLAKIPVNPYDGNSAKANNPTTWGTYSDARKAVQNYNLAGVGFEFGVHFQGIVGVDLDNVILEDGTLKPFAAEIVKKLDSYTEYSPSGKGLHILCEAKEGMENWSYHNVLHRNDALGLEMYDSKRFFTITGNVYGSTKDIKERTAELKEVYAKYLHKELNSNAPSASPVSPLQQVPTSGTVINASMPDEDKELWDKMFKSQNGDKIISLFNGDTSGYDNDDSRADLALCNHLAYWTGNNVVRIDRMFRQSKLMRPKWDTGNNPSYGQRTIEKALSASTQQVFSPLLESFPLHPLLNPLPPYPTPVVTSRNDMSVSDYLDGIFDEDVRKFRDTSSIKTGFSNIDAQTSLYPGLYLLGAVPGLGKTTFASQLADNLSMNGKHVLFFSLEQRRIELVAKGLSRLTVYLGTAMTSIEIRTQGTSNPLVKQAVEKYKTFSSNEHFLCCGFATFDLIRDKVQNYINEKQARPIVIVDYLQIIQQSDTTKNTTKDVIDAHVREFKKLQLSNDLVIILISSLNRANYITPIDYESFKETGALEYTCDCVWGLQLQVMNEAVMSDKKESVSEKRKKVKDAKEAIPRKLELVCLKNRFGCTYSCHFDYYPQYDFFFVPSVQGGSNQVVNSVPVSSSAYI